nr:uncharacterized protein LOC778744 [Ciona intestinalis]|eukprot:XP_026691658.1 uncharacterized protein LOC778744 [Ciona intestinalis]
MIDQFNKDQKLYCGQRANKPNLLVFICKKEDLEKFVHAYKDFKQICEKYEGSMKLVSRSNSLPNQTSAGNAPTLKLKTTDAQSDSSGSKKKNKNAATTKQNADHYEDEACNANAPTLKLNKAPKKTDAKSDSSESKKKNGNDTTTKQNADHYEYEASIVAGRTSVENGHENYGTTGNNSENTRSMISSGEFKEDNEPKRNGGDNIEVNQEKHSNSDLTPKKDGSTKTNQEKDNNTETNQVEVGNTELNQEEVGNTKVNQEKHGNTKTNQEKDGNTETNQEKHSNSDLTPKKNGNTESNQEKVGSTDLNIDIVDGGKSNLNKKVVKPQLPATVDENLKNDDFALQSTDVLMTLNEYEVGVVTFWESCQQLPSLWSKHDVQLLSSKNGNQTIKISSKNAIEFMQEFQSLYNDAKLKMQHKFVQVSKESKKIKKQLKLLNDTCKLAHCAFYYDAPNLMVVMGSDIAMLDHCHSQLQSQKYTNANPTQSLGTQVSSDSQVPIVYPSHSGKTIQRGDSKDTTKSYEPNNYSDCSSNDTSNPKPVVVQQNKESKVEPTQHKQQNATELPSNISVHRAVEKEYTDTITVDKDVYSYIQLSKANRVKQIWERHQIKIKTTKVGQDNLSIELTSKYDERIVQAIDEFQRLYQDTMDHIQQANIECEFDSLDDIEKAVNVVRANNKDVLVCQSSDNNHRVIMLSEDKEALKASKRVFQDCLNSISDKPTQLPKQPSLASRDNYIEVFKFVTKGGISVSVGNGNIALQDVDAIVNAANKYIENGAGVTGAIFRQGGWEFEQVCQKAMKRRHRPLAVGEVVSVKAAGRLQCKKVLHLVGPQWYKYSNKQEAYQLLESGLLSVLEESDCCGVFTLALPPVATVVYGTPLNAFVQAMNTALTCFETSYPRSTRVLNYIRILSIDQSTVSILATMFSSSVKKDRSSSVDPSSHHHHTSAQPLGGNDEDIDGGEVPMEIDDVYDGHSSYKYQSNAQQSQQSTSQVTEKKSYAAAAKSSSHDTRAVSNIYENKVQLKQQTDEWKMTAEIFPQTASTEYMYHLHISIPSLHYQDMYRKTAYIPNVEGAREVIKRIGKLVKAKKLFQLKYSADPVCSCKLKSLAFNMFDIKENYMENLQNELLELEKKEYQKPTEKDSEKGKNGKKEQENGKGKESNTEEDEKEQCAICLDDINGSKIKTLPCKHKFHETCVNQALKVNNLCPICKQAVGKVKGNQPNGTMRDRIDHNTHLPGYERYGAIVIDYNFPSGIQGREHPNPGVRYTGTSRTAYLPDNREGREVLRLLKKAFDARLIFTIGRSVTTGMENQVTWNDIHHKTNPYGGATGFGYPDPDYLNRVKDELKAKGIQ